MKQRQTAVLQRRLNAGRQSKSLKTTAPNRNSLFSSGARSKEKFASASHVISRDHNQVSSDQKRDKQQIVHHQPSAAGQSGKSAALLKLMEIAGDDWSQGGSGEAKEMARSGPRRRQEFSCPLTEGHFPDPGSCSVYYQCAQGTPHRRQCEAGLSWSVETDQCDWEDNVTCTRGQRP